MDLGGVWVDLGDGVILIIVPTTVIKSWWSAFLGVSKTNDFHYTFGLCIIESRCITE